MTAQAKLARRYRRLLASYPRAYRQERGAEILDTMLESAPEDRARPTFRESANLVVSGLRCRLGRPRSRVVVVLSLLTAVMAGVVGAAVSDRLAWQTAAPLPSGRAAQHVFDLTLGEANPQEPPHRDPALFGYSWEMSRWDTVKRLVSLGGWDEYGPRALGRSGQQNRVGDPHGYAASAAARLRSDGWQVSPHSYGCEGSPCSAARFTEFNARKGHTVLNYGAMAGTPMANGFLVEPAGNQLRADVTLYRTRPALVVPAEIAGGLLGALLAWLVFGWVSRRTWRRGALIQTATYLLYGAHLLLWTPATLLTVTLLVFAHGHPRPNDWQIPSGELFFVLLFPGLGVTLLGAAAAAALVGIAALARPGRTAEIEQAGLLS